MRSQRTSLVPLFKLGDAVTRVKMQVDDTLDSCGAVVISDDCPKAGAGYSSWGEEAVPALFKPLQSPPQIDVQIENDELQPDGLDLDPDTVKIIQERAKAKLDASKEHACKAVAFSQGLLMMVY